MSDKKSHHRYSAHMRLFGTLATCVIVLGGVGFGAYYAYSHNQQTKKSTADTSSAAKSTSKQTPDLSSLTPDQKAQYYADDGQYQAAEQSWQEKLAGTTDASDKAAIYFQQSSLAIQFKHYADAKKYADEAQQVAPNTPDPYASLALLAQAQHNNSLAKQYWQQAIDHVNSTMPGYNVIKEDYQNQLDALK